MKLDYDDLYALDLETAPVKQTDKPYALEPFRYSQLKAKITSCAVHGPMDFKTLSHIGQNLNPLQEPNFHLEVIELLRYLQGKTVIAHNAVFDIAWLIEAYGLDSVRHIKWRDSSLAAKWILNSQRLEYVKGAMKLVNLVKRYLPHHPLHDEFVDVKKAEVKPGEDYEYWLRRNRMDAELTLELYKHIVHRMEESQYRGFIIEQSNLVPVANSWNHGIYLDEAGNKEVGAKILRAKNGLAKRINKPHGMFSSPKQLGAYLFDDLGLTPAGKTPKGAPSVSADNLKLMRYDLKETEYDDILQTILNFKKVRTTESKFVEGIRKVIRYNGEAVNHSAPRIFGTYTGRFTYSSKTLNKELYRPGIATHQLPRTGPIRGLVVAPEGYEVGELDAAAQEMRGMAIESRDEHMLYAFNHDMNLHSSMGAEIQGLSYEEFERLRALEDKEVINFRYAGKLLNLSCQYRIGYKALAKKFFTQYDIYLKLSNASRYLRTYKKHYPGIPKYWDDAIRRARINGFAESIGGRRYYIDQWGDKGSWRSEQSAINFPIQGMGGDHKNVAIGMLFKKFPEAIFALDLHDGLWYYLPKPHARELLLDMKSYMNSVNYETIWNKEIPIPLPFDAQLGTSFGSVHEIK